MPDHFPVIGILGKTGDARVNDTLESLLAFLAARSHGLILSETLAGAAPDRHVEHAADDALTERADLVIAIGGDGTMLYAARLAAPANRPLLGINRGRLGFLADISPDEMLERLEQVLRGDYVEEQRLMLMASSYRGDSMQHHGLALNDIVLQRADGGRLIDFETMIDDGYVNSHSGDGLIVATPTGSTAYSLSCGGPILHPGLASMALVPICPHTLSDRPIVVTSGSRIEIRLTGSENQTAQVVHDGQTVTTLAADERLVITAAPHKARLLHPADYDYFRILRSKLHWGRGAQKDR